MRQSRIITRNKKEEVHLPLDGKGNGAYRGISKILDVGPQPLQTANTKPNGYHPNGTTQTHDTLSSISISPPPATPAERQQQWIQRLKPLQSRYLQPFAALVGLTLESEQPIVYTPYHPKSGHAVFIFASLPLARHYLDSFLFSLKLSTPTLEQDGHIHLFVPPTTEDDLGHKDGAAAFLHPDFAMHMVAPDQAAAEWRLWAGKVQNGEVGGSWRTLHLLVVDDLGYWARQATENQALERAITTVLTRGLARRVVVVATTTYDDWFRLPKAWRQAFAVGFYGGLHTTPWSNDPRFPQALRALGPAYGLIAKDDRTVPFRSVMTNMPM